MEPSSIRATIRSRPEKRRRSSSRSSRSARASSTPSSGCHGRPQQPSLVVGILGEGIDLPPCRFALRPRALAFGDVAPGSRRTRSVEVRDVGDADCLITDVRLLSSTDPEMELVSTERQAILIPPGAGHLIDVAYAPTANGRVNWTYDFTTNTLAFTSDAPAGTAVEVRYTAECL